MKRHLSAQDVLSDIEFELIQGAVSREELARSIRQVRMHHDRVRQEYFSSDSRMDRDTLVARQFQFHDMLLTLLEEMAADGRAVKLELQKLGEMAFANAPAERAERDQRLLTDMWLTSELTPYLDGWPPHEIEEAMSEKSLIPEMVVQPSRIPLIGGLLNRIRIALHRVAIFYVGRVARRQAKTNAVYGTWIERLVSHVHEQHEKIRILDQRLQALERDVGARRGDPDAA